MSLNPVNNTEINTLTPNMTNPPTLTLNPALLTPPPSPERPSDNGKAKFHQNHFQAIKIPYDRERALEKEAKDNSAVNCTIKVASKVAIATGVLLGLAYEFCDNLIPKDNCDDEIKSYIDQKHINASTAEYKCPNNTSFEISHLLLYASLALVLASTLATLKDSCLSKKTGIRNDIAGFKKTHRKCKVAPQQQPNIYEGKDDTNETTHLLTNTNLPYIYPKN